MLRTKLDRIMSRRNASKAVQEQIIRRMKADLERLRSSVAAAMPSDITADVARLLNVPIVSQAESMVNVNSEESAATPQPSDSQPDDLQQQDVIDVPRRRSSASGRM